MTARRLGRPPLPPEQRRSEWVTVRLTPAEADDVARAAVQGRVSMSEVIRRRAGLQAISVTEEIPAA